MRAYVPPIIASRLSALISINHARRGPAHRRQHRQAAGAIGRAVKLLFDHFVGGREQHRRDGDPERVRALEIDD